MKDLWIKCFEDLKDKYFEDNPNATEEEAEQFACKHADDEASYRFSRKCDREKDRLN